MARPIEATPPVTGEDAVRLLEDLKNCCSEEEGKRRSRAAHLHLMRWRSTEELELELADITAELDRRKAAKR